MLQKDNYMEIIDAKGLPCPKPVMLVKKALDIQDEIIIEVDNETAADNIRMFAESKGCDVNISPEGDSIYHVHINNIKKSELKTKEIMCNNISDNIEKGPTVFVFSSNSMGNGDDKLGHLLIKGFIHATTELERLPEIMVFYNTGVKLLTVDSGTAEDICNIEKRGVKVIACGTCVNYFEIGDKIAAGSIGNMYDIVSILSSSVRIVTP
jgi:selenium metabolism protein YedF